MKGESNKALLIIAGIFILIMFISFLNSNRDLDIYTQTSITVASDAAEGLDLKALTEIVKKAKSAEDLEMKLNRSDGINNLDLNEDNKVDFISVTEYGNKADAHGFSLTTSPAKGEIQEIASIEISKSGEKADIEIRGNEQIYGRGHYYHDTHYLTSFLLWSYLFHAHPFYYSSWHYGYYPRYYGAGYAPINNTAYRTRTGNISRNSTATKASSSKMTSRTGVFNPNKNKSANKGIKQRLRRPTTTQKSFQARNPSKAARSGGFGRRSVRTPSRSRSYGGFGK